MSKNMTKVALIYDFDGTLCTSDMQNFALIPALGMKPKEFWRQANEWSTNNQADQITGSMYYFWKMARIKGFDLTRENMKKMGKYVEYFAGVTTWFDRISRFGAELDLDVEHYVISAGYEEIIDGCEIKKFFKNVFGCSFAYNAEGKPIWPARVVNYSTKTQYLSKINKGLGKTDDKAVNEFTPDESRPIPYRRMIFFGDGMTDIPCMRMTKDRGGHAIAVYPPRSKHKKFAIKLLSDNRVNFALPADYSNDTQIDIVVKTILDKIATERDLEVLKLKEDKKIPKKQEL